MNFGAAGGHSNASKAKQTIPCIVLSVKPWEFQLVLKRIVNSGENRNPQELQTEPAPVWWTPKREYSPPLEVHQWKNESTTRKNSKRTLFG
jgi:hypothetical protein